MFDPLEEMGTTAQKFNEKLKTAKYKLKGN
jgi:hypothetical protein